MNKTDLRQQFLNQRIALSEADYDRYNQLLKEVFFKYVALESVKVMHSFLPLRKKKEPDTWLILNQIQEQHALIKLSVPKINIQTGLIESFYFREGQPLEENVWGIPEPMGGERVNERDIDLVLVPLLAFDKQGHRVGYGKGYYDRFLKLCRPDCLRIGLSFFEAVDEIRDFQNHDEKLRAVITPKGWISFS